MHVSRDILQNFVMKLNNICGTRIRHVAFAHFHVETEDFTRMKNQKLHKIIFIIYTLHLRYSYYQKIEKKRSCDFFINDMNHQQLEERLY